MKKSINQDSPVAHDKEKVKAYLVWIRNKLAQCKTEADRNGYRDYCLNECKKWDKDVNYHDAVRQAFKIDPSTVL